MKRYAAHLAAAAISAATVLFNGVAFGQSAMVGEDGYGPDWPVCRDLGQLSRLNADACTRLLEGGKLSRQHTSWAHNDRGLAWKAIGETNLAFEDFTAAIIADPENGAPYSNRGAMYDSMHMQVEAIADLTKAIGLLPNSVDIRCRRGQIFHDRRLFEDAIADFSKVLAIKPDFVCALTSRALTYADISNYPAALDDADQAIQLVPRYSYAYYVRGRIFNQLRQSDRAANDLTTAFELNPGDPYILRERAKAYNESGQYQKAVLDLTAAINLTGEDLEAYRARAGSFFSMGQYDLAGADCTHALSIDPNDILCQDYILRALMLSGKFREVSMKATELIAIPNAQGYLSYRAVSKYAMKDYASAATDFAAFLKLDPDNPYGLLWLYLTERRLGKDDRMLLADAASKRDAWPNPILRYIQGTATADDVLAAADVPNKSIRRQRLAEANFYLGELEAIDGDSRAAHDYYTEALDAGEVEVSQLDLIPLYKYDDDIEIAVAKASLEDHPL